MYAVITSGGKQYRVEEGQALKLETLPVEVGGVVDFNDVLMLADGDKIKVGTPYLKGVKVSAEVLNHGRAKKIKVIKFKRRKQHMKQMGHRQNFTEVKITAIGAGKKKAAAASSKKAVADEAKGKN